MEKDDVFLFGSSAATVKEPGLLHPDADPAIDTAFALYEHGKHPGRVVVALSSDRIGETDPKHGAELMTIFLQNLCECSLLPDEVLLYHRGVLLSCSDHSAMDFLCNLCDRDVEVKVCMESLNYFCKKPAEAKMLPVPMSEITRSLLTADRLICP